MIHSLISIFIAAIVFCFSIQANTRMLIVSNYKFCGERELAWRIKLAGEKLGWTVYLDEYEGGRRFNYLKQLDMVICLVPNNEFIDLRCPNYMTIFHPFTYLDDERNLLTFYQRYDGYLLTVNDRMTIAESLKENNKEFFSIPFYPSIYKVPYKRIDIKGLVTMIPVWSNRLKDEKFRTLYKLLSRSGLVKFYGVSRNEDIIEEGYVGNIPFDGISVIDILQLHGIVLVLHSDIHNQEGIPSSRIFEAAAASMVIISDENPFVKEHFGDSVFYIDTSLPAEDINSQIMDHLNTIHLYPERALEMAKEAYEIFNDNFEMSDQLLKLEALNRKIKLEKANRND